MKLIVISSPTIIEQEHSILESLFKSGLEYFHLRKPSLGYEELEVYIRQIPMEFRNRVILHSHHQLAIENKLKGVHYTASTPFNEAISFPSTIQQSASIHTLAELKNVNTAMAYVLLSPIFDSISKKESKASFEKEKLYEALQNKEEQVEVIALGGIHEDTIYDALELGFDGVAALGTIWNAGNPVKNYSQLADIREAIMELDNLFDE